VIYLVLMFASAAVAITLGVAMHDWVYTSMAVGVLALCVLLLAIGHDAIPTRGQKRRRAERQAAEEAFEAASHAAYLRMVDRAGRRRLSQAERDFMEAHS